MPAGFSNFDGLVGVLAQVWETEETFLLGLATTVI
jgi:hypothetical protein